MVNDIIEELMNLDMEPKPESLWWRSTDKEEEEMTLKVGCRGEIGEFFMEVFDVWGREDCSKWTGELVA